MVILAKASPALGWTVFLSGWRANLSLERRDLTTDSSLEESSSDWRNPTRASSSTERNTSVTWSYNSGSSGLLLCSRSYTTNNSCKRSWRGSLLSSSGSSSSGSLLLLNNSSWALNNSSLALLTRSSCSLSERSRSSSLHCLHQFLAFLELNGNTQLWPSWHLSSISIRPTRRTTRRNDPSQAPTVLETDSYLLKQLTQSLPWSLIVETSYRRSHATQCATFLFPAKRPCLLSNWGKRNSSWWVLCLSPNNGPTL